VPFGNSLPIKVPEGPPDDRFVYLSDVLPTAWQAVEYANVKPDSTVAVLGLGPIGDMACRVARHKGARVIGIDLVPERLARAKDLTNGRGPDAVIDAVGMEAHGAPVGRLAQQLTGLLPDTMAQKLMKEAGVDRLKALYSAIDMVRRGGTISIVGVYGGMADPLPMLTMFDKQLQLRMGQANVWRWVPEILPLLTDDDPLGVDDFATHRLPLQDAPRAYETFQKKNDGMVKVLLKP
jgi:threonine dehydrogenase-like Zn-dependent dehydrogenase